MQLSPPKSGDELIDMLYHDMRSHLLEVASAFDRIERAGGHSDARLAQLRAAGDIAIGQPGDRARRFLELLSV